MVKGRPVTKVRSAMSVEELVDRRAKVYDKLLDPEYANVHPSSTGTGAMHNVDRGTLEGLDEELIKRGEDISMFPDAPAYDPSYVQGSGTRAPYLRSIDEAVDASKEVISAASTTPVVGSSQKAEEIVSKVTASAESAGTTKITATAVKVEVGNLSAAVATSAPVPPAAPVSAVADALVASGTTTAAGAAAGTKTSAGILNVGKKIVSNPKHMAALGVAAAAGIIAFRSI